MKIEKIKVSDLKPYENNAKIHTKEQVEQIKKSIQEFGFNDPIAVDENNMIVEGHGRLMAVKALGYTEVDCIRLDGMTDEQKRAYIHVHNQLTLNTGFDLGILEAELKSIENIDMGAFGFDMDFDLDTDFDFEATEDDYEAEIPEEPKAKLGDIYQLGRHRLMCGDSTSITDVDKLLNGEKVDMIFTDPPYNVSFNGRSGEFDVIKNDDLSESEFHNFIQEVIGIIKTINPPVYYIWCNWKFYAVLQENMEYKSCIVWAKNVFGMGKGYRHQHEFCLFNGTIDEGINNESDLWEIKKDHNYVHPTQKPVELSFRALGNHKNAKNILDLFGGSGSTLIGCEQLDRSCYMMELDPKYVDVIIARWEQFTGEKAVLLNGNR